MKRLTALVLSVLLLLTTFSLAQPTREDLTDRACGYAQNSESNVVKGYCN